MDLVVLGQVVLEAMELGLEGLVQVVLDQEALVQVAKAQVWSTQSRSFPLTLQKEH